MVNEENKYSLAELDLENPKTSHDYQIILTGTGKKVLEFGTATGYISNILNERNCDVIGIEKNISWANSAKKFCRKIIVGDIENIDFKKELDNEKFDVILFGDVIEHLKNPQIILEKIQDHLLPNGFIILSIPNISHITIRLQILNGRFDYEQTGILDDTHLKFYTLYSIIELLNKTGYTINELIRIKQDFDINTRTDFDSLNFPLILLDSILDDPESTTFQYILKATVGLSSQKTEFPQANDFVTKKLKLRQDEFLLKISNLNQVIKDHEELIYNIKNSKLWKLVPIFDKIRSIINK